ncbi:DUF262 domain-containing protein [Exiguobacterium sp. TRN 1102]|uniref:DUF262 domain-containing protein n=1 Tax=unclassified Exiguobacterium TaxID=2644629 RepID=UPI001BE6AFA5|nr:MULTISPECIES: DUF262 domain-containing protein [unclassified Exiguobacterium]
MLDAEVKAKSKEIYTDSYTMSIGELANMYVEGELELQPEYQRFFRWSNTQKTAFIESILLGIPIPPIFIFQKEDGIWTVIDGLQRLSTIFQFMGILEVKDDEEYKVEDLELQETRFLPSLKGKKWERGDLDLESDKISTNLKLFFKRSRMDVKIIQYTSDVDAQYELFQRLNTGGATLSHQEIRNSLMVMENKEFFTWFESLRKNAHFQNCLPLSQKQMSEKEDMEYLLRFLIYRFLDPQEIRGNEDVGPFLTEKMHQILKSDLNLERETVIFDQVFKLLDEVLGENSFKKYDLSKENFVRAVSLAHFEMIVPGLAQSVINSPLDEDNSDDRREWLLNKIKNLSRDDQFLIKKDQHRPVLRTKELISYSREYFNGQ